MTQTCPFPAGRSHPLEPLDGMRELAEAGTTRVTFPNGVQSWYVTRYEDARTVLSDRRFSARKDNDGPGNAAASGFNANTAGNIIVQDGDDHLRLRRPLSRGFTVRRIAELRPRIEQLVDEQLDKMELGGTSADLVESLCLQVPALTVAELLGVPREHQGLFHRTADALMARDSMSVYRDLSRELGGVLYRIIETKRAERSSDDLLGIIANDPKYDVSTEELIALSITVLVAGLESTATAMGLFVLMLFEHPDQLNYLRRNLHDEDAVAAVVDELLRHTLTITTGNSMHRRAIEDVQLTDVLVRAGDWVSVSMMANRDPAFCPGGDALDLSRGSTAHLGFGFGPHQCIGHNLVRAELQIMVRKLFSRFPGLRPAYRLEDLEFRTDMLVYSAARIPVVW